MAASFTKVLYDAIQAGTIKCNLGGVAMGDPWIDPMSCVSAWGPYLAMLGEVDGDSLDQINADVAETQKLVDNEQWDSAADQAQFAAQTVQAVCAYLTNKATKCSELTTIA